jgi:putative serine protease PepD
LAVRTDDEPAGIVNASDSGTTLETAGDSSSAASGSTVAAVAALLGPSVVQVETNLGLGSGVVYDDGFVLTNHHVIANASTFAVRTADGRRIEARLVGSDPRNDIAVLEVGADQGLPVAELGLDRGLVVGETAVAIGSPFQLQQTVTAGIVSALNRPVPNNNGGVSAMIQTDAPINPGNSGGALADINGRVVGINTSIRTDGSSNSNVGIGFAVPIEVAVDVASRIRTDESLEPGVLGVQAAAAADDEIGVELGVVTPGSAADAAGLRAGDRILTIDDAPVTEFTELAGLVQSRFRGDVIELLVERDGERQVVTATLG